MSLFYEILQYLCAIGEVFICYCFVGAFKDIKLVKENQKHIIISSLIIGLALAVNRVKTGLASWFMLIFLSILIFISLSIMDKKIQWSDFCIVIAYNVYVILLQLLCAFCMLTVFCEITVQQVYFNSGIYKSGCYLISLLAICIIYLILSRYQKLKDISLKPFQWTFFLYGLAGIFGIAMFQSQLLTYGKRRSSENLFIILMLTGATIMILLAIINNVETRTKLDILKQKNKMLEDNYKEICNMYKNYVYTYHDMKNHLIILESYYKTGDIEKAVRYIEKIQNPIRKVKQYINSGNEMMDMILNYKLSEAEKKHIDIEALMGKINVTWLREDEMCIILSNLLDNAIEACEQMTHGNKWIRICVKIMGDILFINISNSYSGQYKTKNGKLQTLKKGLHGYGMQSVESKIEKYGGDIKWEYNENIFMVSITLFNMVNENKIEEVEKTCMMNKGY